MVGSESRLVIVIPNYNGSEMLMRCLGSIADQTMQPDEVIVVDNASTDDSLQMVNSMFPAVRVIALKTNFGFAGGVNIGFKAVMNSDNFRYLAVINNDALLDKNWVELLVEFMNENPAAGSCQGKVVFTDGRGINTLGVVPLRDGGAYNLGIGLPDEELPIFEIFGVSGAAAMYRKEALQSSGLFDEDFFMYMEDVDLAWRLRWSGWSSYLIGGAVAVHAHSASNKNPSRKIYYVIRNSNYVCFKDLPFALVLTLPFSFILIRLKGALSRRERFNSMTKGVGRSSLPLVMINSFKDVIPVMPSLMVKRRAILGNKKKRWSKANSWFDRFGSNLEDYLVDRDDHIR